MTDTTRKPLTYRRHTWLMGMWALGLGCALCVLGWGIGAAFGWDLWKLTFWLGCILVAGGVVWLVTAPLKKDEPVSRAYLRYMRTFMPGMGGYVLAILVMSSLSDLDLPTWVMVLVGLLPVLPMVWVVFVMWRFTQDSDELERRVQQEAVFMTCGVVGVVSFAAGMLESVGVFHIKAGLILVLPAMFAVYAISSWWCRRKYGLSGGC